MSNVRIDPSAVTVGSHRPIRSGTVACLVTARRVQRTGNGFRCANRETSLVAGCDESSFVSEDDRLDSVAQTEFHEDPGHVGFDGSLAHD